MKPSELICTAIVAVLIVGSGIVGIWSKHQPQAAAQQAFDHSQCQYPSRTTNPPNGCDNSDPANPYCAVKGLPEDCQEPQAVQPAPTPTEITPAPAKVSECGGK